MKIAVTYENGNVFPHFGRTEQFKLYTETGGKITGSRIIGTNGQGHGALAGLLAAEGIDVLICGGIGPGAQLALSEAGIRLFAGAQGSADGAVEALLQGTLSCSAEANCTLHSHGEAHDCGGRGCGSCG